MAKGKDKQIAELFSQLDLSDLSSAQQKEFQSWLAGRPNMQTVIRTALRKGHLVKAYSNTYRLQTDYWLRIEDTDNQPID